jgi:hypothetical protein
MCLQVPGAQPPRRLMTGRHLLLDARHVADNFAFTADSTLPQVSACRTSGASYLLHQDPRIDCIRSLVLIASGGSSTHRKPLLGMSTLFLGTVYSAFTFRTLYS